VPDEAGELIVRRSLASVAWLSAVVACGGPPAGICDLGTLALPSETLVTSPSTTCYAVSSGPHMNPDGTLGLPSITRSSQPCPGPICLRVPLGRVLPPGGLYPNGFPNCPTCGGISSSACESDADCPDEAPCVTGFTCAVPPGLTVGPQCCKRLCLCKDYVALPPSTNELPVPAACDASNASNTCCNLPGRPACNG
jgi:hypothetical protein